MCVYNEADLSIIIIFFIYIELHKMLIFNRCLKNSFNLITVFLFQHEIVVVQNSEQAQRISALVEHISDLEKQIQKLNANTPIQPTDLTKKNDELKSELEKSNKKVIELETELNNEVIL